MEKGGVKVVELREIVTDPRARDGTWCQLPYPNHIKGCPNYPLCITKREPFESFREKYEWHAYYTWFDIEAWAEKRKKDAENRGTPITEKQARIVYLWQGHVESEIRKRIINDMGEGDILLEVPEAYGINMFATMKKVGISLKADYSKMVCKIMLLGKNKRSSTLEMF